MASSSSRLVWNNDVNLVLLHAMTKKWAPKLIVEDEWKDVIALMAHDAIDEDEWKNVQQHYNKYLKGAKWTVASKGFFALDNPHKGTPKRKLEMTVTDRVVKKKKVAEKDWSVAETKEDVAEEMASEEEKKEAQEENIKKPGKEECTSSVDPRRPQLRASYCRRVQMPGEGWLQWGGFVSPSIAARFVELPQTVVNQ